MSLNRVVILLTPYVAAMTAGAINWIVRNVPVFQSIPAEVHAELALTSAVGVIALVLMWLKGHQSFEELEQTLDYADLAEQLREQPTAEPVPAAAREQRIRDDAGLEGGAGSGLANL
jgi:hypothetical protein